MDKKSALLKTQGICSQSEKCSFDIEVKLKKWELSSDDINSILESLLNEKYIDNTRYTNAFVMDKFKFNKWGKIKISHHLRLKNINSKIIQEALNNIPDEEYEETIKNEIKKKLKSLKETEPFKLKTKLIRHAISKGFENGKVFDIVNSTLKNNLDQ